MRNTRFLFFSLSLGISAIAVVILISGQATAAIISAPSAMLWAGLAVLVTILPVSGMAGVRTLNISPLPLLTMLLIYGTGPAMLAGWVCGVVATAAARTRSPLNDIQRGFFNSAKHVLCLLAAGLVLWGPDLSVGCLDQGLSTVVFMRLLAGHIVYVIVGTAILSSALWLRDNRRPGETWRSVFEGKALVSWSTPLGAALLAVFYMNGGFLLIGILIATGLIGILTVRDHVRIKSSFVHLVDALRLARDGNMPHLKGETQGVLELAMALGRKMHLPYGSLELLERSAMLHNVGYIAVDRATVLKQSLLSDAEMSEIREHPESGMRILREVAGMDGVADIVASHHESPDGTGYPRGLKTSQIPIEAAVIKVAEAYVAMTNPRPHRTTPLSKGEALVEIAKDAGHALDATVAYYLFELMGRPDLANRVAGGFGPPTRELVKVRLHRTKPKPWALFPHRRKERRSMLIGSAIVAAAALIVGGAGHLGISLSLGLSNDQAQPSALGGLFFLFLLGLAALRPVRLPKGAYVSASSAVVLAASLLGGPVYAVILGIAVIGWALMLDPGTALATSAAAVNGNGLTSGWRTRVRLANGRRTGLDRRDKHSGGIAYIIKSKALESRLSTASAYGFLLMLAGSGAWLAYYSGQRVSHLLGLERTAGEIIPFVLSVGTFYLLETLVQSMWLSAHGLGARRIWQRNYLKIFPEPLTYAVCGYAILLSASLLGLWAAIPLFLFPTLWRHLALLRRLELMKTQESLIRAIARAVDEKDRYTGGHSASVVEVATAIARQMGKSEPFVEQLEEAAIRHDLGKVAWPHQVLRKPALLDQVEEEEYKWTHPEVSAEIAARAGSARLVTEMIRYHHERLDGKGYPHRLHGDAIPLGSRILCVADSFDAMIHDRWYRRKRTLQGAIDEVKRCSGSQFDPEVVEAFLAAIAKVDLEQLIEAVEMGVGEISEDVGAPAQV